MKTDEKLYGVDQTMDSMGMGSRIQSALEFGKNRLSEIGYSVGNRSKDLARRTDQCVHQNAWIAFGSALCLGLAAGFFLSRRY